MNDHEMQARITIFGDGDIVIIAPKAASPGNRQLVEAWIKSFMDKLFDPPPPNDKPEADETDRQVFIDNTNAGVRGYLDIDDCKRVIEEQSEIIRRLTEEAKKLREEAKQ